MRTRGGANGILVPEAIAYGGGETGLKIALETVRAALTTIGNGFDQVPEDWWVAANIRPERIEETLWERMNALPNLINITQWGGGYADGEAGEIPLIQL